VIGAFARRAAKEEYMRIPARCYFAVGILALVGFGFLPSDFPTTVAHAQNRYREDPKLRKSRAREALTKAMTLNAQVEMMLMQNSDQTAKMIQMLSQSYGYQVTSIAQLEGVVREASFKDPVMERGILDMYERGKPETMLAQTHIKNGDYGAAANSLTNAKASHRRFMVLLY
jgi:hypothetical protein